jgi:NADPH:quinone reductase-like Zn-dependent oxidoreductase
MEPGLSRIRWRHASFGQNHASLRVSRNTPPFSMPDVRDDEMKASLALQCLGPGHADLLVVRSLAMADPKPDEIEVAVEAAAVNPIDVRRADGYGRRLLSLMNASKFPLVLGNDFFGAVTATGTKVTGFKTGDRVFGVKPASSQGTHASRVLVKADFAALAPPGSDLSAIAALPYSFATMWLAVTGAGLTRENASGRAVLVHGAAGGLGTLALQLLSSWGARVTAIAWPSSIAACQEAGASDVHDATKKPLASLGPAFDVTLNFATWEDDLAMVRCLRVGALGHATTVHPLLANFDNLGWVRGGLASLREKRRHAAALPEGTKRYNWTLFRPNPQGLAELRSGLHEGRFRLPIGMRVPLGQAVRAFDHVREGRPGRALLLPAEEAH